jgi:hypothetical protein
MIKGPEPKILASKAIISILASNKMQAQKIIENGLSYLRENNLEKLQT